MKVENNRKGPALPADWNGWFFFTWPAASGQRGWCRETARGSLPSQSAGSPADTPSTALSSMPRGQRPGRLSLHTPAQSGRDAFSWCTPRWRSQTAPWHSPQPRGRGQPRTVCSCRATGSLLLDTWSKLQGCRGGQGSQNFMRYSVVRYWRMGTCGIAVSVFFKNCSIQ